MDIKKVRVNAGAGYDVSIAGGLLDVCGDITAKAAKGAKSVVITDSNVAPLYLDRVLLSFQKAGIEADAFTFPAGEKSKNLNTLSGILEFMAEKKLTRADCAVALGGGVAGDMTGFAAGCYMRGIRYIQIPTTLLAAVDSSVGGKTAVNLTAGKNLAGLFLQPSAVICDTDLLDTLSPETFADGAAEAIKTAVLADEELFGIFESGNAKKRISDIIAKCVKYKGSIVEEDEREGGKRKLLNLGHTVGHAVEKCSGFSIPHGHAVSIGTAIIAGYAESRGYCEKSCAKRIVKTLAANGLPVSTDFSSEQLAEAVIADKKRIGGRITLIIPKRIGECMLLDTDISAVYSVIKEGREAL